MASSSYCQLWELNNELTPNNTFKYPIKKKRNQPDDDIDTRLLKIEEEKLKCFQKSANDPNV